MKKKVAFITSFMLCVSMVLTSFSYLSLDFVKVKADPDFSVEINVNNNEIGWAGASNILGGDPLQLQGGSTGQTIYLYAGVYEDCSADYRFKEWQITEGSGEIANPYQNETTFVFGTGNAKIQAFFEEKKDLNATATIEDWIYGEGEISPIIKDSDGNPWDNGYEYCYYTSQACEETDMVNVAGNENPNIPKELGLYYVKIILYPAANDDEHKEQEIVLPFYIKNKISITAQNKTTTYTNGVSYDVSQMFTIPDNAGSATYEVVTGNEAGTGAGTITENTSTLNITKAGTIKVKVKTTGSDNDLIAPAEAVAVLTVNQATITENMLSLDQSSFDHVAGTTCIPVLTVKDGDYELIVGTDYEIVTAESTTSADAVGSYTIKINGKGNYAGSASIGWTINDNTAPVITGVVNESTNYGEVNISVSDAYLSSVTIKEESDEQATNITVTNGAASQKVTELGNYTVTATDNAGNETTYIFTIAQEEIIIATTTNNTTTYAPSATFDVAGLFDIPENAGTATYSIVENDTDTGVGTLGEDGKSLTINKAGTITIEVTTVGSKYVAPAEKTAVLTVNKATLKDDMLSLDYSSFEYVIGTTCRPQLTVKDGDKKLTEGTDYEIVTDESTTNADEIGNYTIKINGKGNYTGPASVSWKIEKKDTTAPTIAGVENNTIYNKAVEIKVTDTYLSSVTIKKDSDELATDITVSEGTASKTVTDLGSYTITATDKAGNEVTCNFTIAKKEITIAAKTSNNIITYDPNSVINVSNLFNIPENAGKATYSIVAGDKGGTGAGALAADGYSLTVTRAGIIIIKVNTAGSDYVAGAEQTNTLTINKAEGSVKIDVKDVKYGENINLTVSSETNTGEYEVKYAEKGETTDTALKETPKEVGAYTVTVTYPGNDLYKEVVESVKFEITPATLTITAENISKKVGSDDPDLTYSVEGLKYGEKAAEVLTGKLSRKGDEKAGEYSILQGDLKANKNYTISFTEAIFTIKPKDVFKISVDLSDKDAGTIDGAKEYEEESTVKLTATANSGYKFVKWQENGTDIETKDEFEFKASSNRNLLAVFEEKKDLTNLTLSANSGTYGDSDVGKTTLSGNEGNGDVSTVYYTDKDCLKKTNSNNGAETEGGVPKSVGKYYVVVTVIETENYKSKSVSASFEINQKNEGSGSGSGSGLGTGSGTVTSTGLSFNKTNITLYVKDNVGSSAGLIANLIPSDVSNKNINWSVSDEEIVSLSANSSTSGSQITITAKKTGTVTITATAADNSSNQNKINVTVKDGSIVEVWYAPKVKWTVKFPGKFTKGTEAPELEYTITYTSANTNETKTSDPIKVTATSTNNFSAGSADLKVTFVATADLKDYFEDKEGTKPAQSVELSKTYKFKEGNDVSGIGTQSGSSESEPEDNVAYNLFYDCEIIIPIPDGADPTKGTGKWTSFYKVESDGKVTVTGDRKKAASAANSLITMPVFDGETQVGEYSYQLPVSYVKPKLKLSATKATIKKGEEQTVSTVVLEKKSNGMFEPIDVTEQKEGVAYYTATKGTATVEEGDEAGQLLITTSDAAKGKIAIQLDNWTDKVELAFSVSAVAKDVLTVSAKSKVMNVAGGDDAAVTILLNNKEIESDSAVTVTMPKGFDQSGIEVEGIEEGKVTSSELKFSYKDGATVKKGNYLFKFACGKAKVNFKLTVSDAALAEKAVSLKVKTKLDLVSGQKMVIEPTLKGINGEISDIALDAANAELFDIEYNDELNQIYISAKDITKVNSTTKYTFVITLTVGGKECTATLKNQKLQAKNPAVKIAKLTLPKAQASTADAAVNVSATYKLGGKTFSVAPAAVKFTKGTAVEGEEGWFIDSKTNAKVFYNAEEGVIEVKAGATAIKSGSIAVEVSFAGSTKAVKKSLSIKVK
jgi:hypothetical protein